MIYTVTFNPSLDYIVDVPDFKEGMTNRTSKEMIYPGGKGINVSIVLRNLGIESIALGFAAGFTGEEIKCLMAKSGVKNDFITCAKGISRINFKIRNIDGTEINGMGPQISSEEIEELYKKLSGLKDGDSLILAGSIPASMPETIYMDILEYLSGKKLDIVVDATKDLLMNVLKYHPFLIKPNNHELGEIFGLELKSEEELIVHAKKLQELGARNVLVSMAGDGALLLAENGDVFRAKPPKGKLINAVGAGDSMVAGFVAGFKKSQSYEKAFYMGLCTGSASAFSEKLATEAEVKALLEQIGKLE
jgi:1-phosphofructokinase